MQKTLLGFFSFLSFFPRKKQSPKKLFETRKGGEILCFTWKIAKILFWTVVKFTLSAQREQQNIHFATENCDLGAGTQSSLPIPAHPKEPEGNPTDALGITWPSHRHFQQFCEYSTPKSVSVLAGIFHVSTTVCSVGSKFSQRARGSSPSGYF